MTWRAKANERVQALRVGDRVVIRQCACLFNKEHKGRSGVITAEIVLTRSGKVYERARAQLAGTLSGTHSHHVRQDVLECRVIDAILEDE